MATDILTDSLSAALNKIGDQLYKTNLPAHKVTLNGMISKSVAATKKQIAKAFDQQNVKRFVDAAILGPDQQRELAGVLRGSRPLGKRLTLIERGLAQEVVAYIQTIAIETGSAVLAKSAKAMQDATPEHVTITHTVTAEDKRAFRDVMVRGQSIKEHVASIIGRLSDLIRASVVDEVSKNPSPSAARAEAQRAVESRFGTLNRSLAGLLTEAMIAADGTAQRMVNAPSVTVIR